MVNKKRGVKEKEGFKLQINLTNRWLYTLILVFSLAIVGVVVYASDHGVSHSATEITGTFDSEQIPNLNASKIDGGVFDLALIPDLSASKITAGTFSSGTFSFPGDLTVDGGIKVYDADKESFLNIRHWLIETDGEHLRLGSSEGILFRTKTGDSNIVRAAITNAGTFEMRGPAKYNDTNQMGSSSPDEAFAHKGYVDSQVTENGGESLWSPSGDDIYYDQGNVIANNSLIVESGRIKGDTAGRSYTGYYKPVIETVLNDEVAHCSWHEETNTCENPISSDVSCDSANLLASGDEVIYELTSDCRSHDGDGASNCNNRVKWHSQKVCVYADIDWA